MALIKIESKDHLDQIINDNERVIVDFYAEWCGPCKVVLPLLEELSGLVGDKFTMVKVDINDHPELTTQYNVRTIPTLISFKSGSQIEVKTGSSTKVDLLRFISNAN